MTNPINKSLYTATADDVCVRVHFYNKKNVLTTQTLILSDRDTKRIHGAPSILDLSISALSNLILAKVKKPDETITLKYFRTIFNSSVRELRARKGKEDAGTALPERLLDAVILKRFYK